MLVEDDEDIREIVGEVLLARGYRVLPARTGIDALRTLRGDGTKPDLILLDMMMPDMDGKQFLKERDADPAIASIPVVVVTAAGRRAQRPPDADCAAWLSKPVDLNVLLSTVARFCRPPIPPSGGDNGKLFGPEQVLQFIDRRLAEIPTMREAMSLGDYQTLRLIGHNLKGVGSSFGFGSLSALGARLEQAAEASDGDTARLVIDELAGALQEARAE